MLYMTTSIVISYGDYRKLVVSEKGMRNIFDIFISYRNDTEGKAIGWAIKRSLDARNYSVFLIRMSELRNISQ